MFWCQQGPLWLGCKLQSNPNLYWSRKFLHDTCLSIHWVIKYASLTLIRNSMDLEQRISLATKSFYIITTSSPLYVLSITWSLTTWLFKCATNGRSTACLGLRWGAYYSLVVRWFWPILGVSWQIDPHIRSGLLVVCRKSLPFCSVFSCSAFSGADYS